MIKVMIGLLGLYLDGFMPWRMPPWPGALTVMAMVFADCYSKMIDAVVLGKDGGRVRAGWRVVKLGGLKTAANDCKAYLVPVCVSAVGTRIGPRRRRQGFYQAVTCISMVCAVR